MWTSHFAFSFLCNLVAISAQSTSTPIATNVHNLNVTYTGLYRSEVEGFVGVRFAQDTGNENRFKPPIPFQPVANSVIDATDPGPSCPQVPQDGLTISEDCLRLNIWRPHGTSSSSNLPVLVWIYGGSFIEGSKDDDETFGGGIVSQSIANGFPILHIAINYRLGIFGFAQSKSLEREGSENIGLRDQRLALEWLQSNVGAFGGNPAKVTIHGQSSGGLSVGMQTLAYGAEKPVPFRGGICESQATEAGITGNFTRRAQENILNATGCNTTDYDSSDTIECLRKLSMNDLLQAQLDTEDDSLAANGGDQWLPVIDGQGGFLPSAPSELVRQGRVANVSLIVGWCENDAVVFTAPKLGPSDNANTFLEKYLPAFSSENRQKALALYPVSEFRDHFFPNGSVSVRAEVYRAARMFREILFTCSAAYVAQGVAAAGNDVFLYHQNQTILIPDQESHGQYGYGVVHDSELAYVFGNLTYYNTINMKTALKASDYTLQDQQSRSWSYFTASSQPSSENLKTLRGWQTAEFFDDTLGSYVIGGPTPGYAGSGQSSAPAAREALQAEKLRERCKFWNDPAVIVQLQW